MMTTRQHPKSLALILGCLFLLVTPLLAFGLSLDEAKQQGLLGERPDGYLGLAKPPLLPMPSV